MKVLNFKCESCKKVFEKFLKRGEDDWKQECPDCHTYAFRIPSPPKMSYLKMGLDPQGNPTAGDKWAKIHEDGAKAEPSHNLVHI